jgi:hypothetical protein
MEYPVSKQKTVILSEAKDLGLNPRHYLPAL